MGAHAHHVQEVQTPFTHSLVFTYPGGRLCYNLYYVLENAVIVALFRLWSNTWESEAGWVVSHQSTPRTALSPCLPRSSAPARRGQVWSLPLWSLGWRSHRDKGTGVSKQADWELRGPIDWVQRTFHCLGCQRTIGKGWENCFRWFLKLQLQVNSEAEVRRDEYSGQMENVCQESEVWKRERSQVTSTRCQLEPSRHFVQLSSLWGCAEPANWVLPPAVNHEPYQSKQGYPRLVSYLKGFAFDLRACFGLIYSQALRRKCAEKKHEPPVLSEGSHLEKF